MEVMSNVFSQWWREALRLIKTTQIGAEVHLTSVMMPR
jgi:hypothetical protein